jgi:dedicator of cytokinesis protein 3
MMEPVATLLEKEFIPSQSSEVPFDDNLWKEAFSMLLKLLSSDHWS